MELSFINCLVIGDTIKFTYIEDSWGSSIIRNFYVAAPPTLSHCPKDWVRRYAQKQFTALLRYMVQQWDTGILFFPEDVIHSIPVDPEEQIFWEGYRLNLNNPPNHLRTSQ